MTPSGLKTAGVFSTLAGKLRGASTVAARPVAQAAQNAAHATMAARPAAQAAQAAGHAAQSGAHATMAARPAAKQPAAFAATHAVPSQPRMDWGAAGGWGGAPSPARAPRAQPNASQTGNPVDQVLPGFLGHDRRLRELQGKLQAREDAGTLSKSRGAILDRIGDERKDLYNQLAARSGDVETTLAPHLRQGREVALGNRGLTEQDTNELFQRAALPRKGTIEDRAKRMMPALSSTQYDRQALMRGEHDPAMRTIANTISDARARNAMIPQAIMPKMSSLRPSLTKRAFLGGALKRFGDLAHTDPVKALARAHAVDQGLRGALYGGLIGGAGGALVSRPGDEENMALRGALAGALGGGGYGAYTGHRDATSYLASPEGLKALAGRLSALRASGAPLSHAFTAYKSAALAGTAAGTLAGLGGGINAVRAFWSADPEAPVEHRLYEGVKGFGTGAALGGVLGYAGSKGLSALSPRGAKRVENWVPFPATRPKTNKWETEEALNKLYQLYKSPLARFGSGALLGLHGASTVKSKLDNWRLAQYAATRMRHEHPDMEQAPELGHLMAMQERGDYRKAP